MAEVEKMKLKLALSEENLKTLKKDLQVTKSKTFQKDLITGQLKKYFSPSQSKQIVEQKRVCWKEDDIINGLLLCSISKRSYLFIRKKQLFPLPAISTLQKWVTNFSCLPGDNFLNLFFLIMIEMNKLQFVHAKI